MLPTRISSCLLVWALLALGLLLTRAPARAQLAPHGSVSGTLTTDASPVTYSFAITALGDYTISLSTGITLYAQILFYDQDGTTQITNNNAGAYGGTSQFIVPHLGPGTYYIHVQELGGQGAYTLRNDSIMPPAVPSDPEPNDTVATAVPMGVIPKQANGLLGYSRTAYNVQDDVEQHGVAAGGPEAG